MHSIPTMNVIDGKKIAEGIINNLKSKPKPDKILAVVQVGENPASTSFIKQKQKTAQELGIDFRIYKFPDPPSGGIKNDDLREEVGKIALLKKVGGVIVQLPLPAHINPQCILNVIPREKDVDVLGERALGAFYTGRNPVLPPSVGVVEEITKIMNYELRITKVIVVGAGFLIGKSIATWLQDKVAELRIFNEYTKDLQDKLKNADLIISGVGKANLFSTENLSENTTVIDFGYDIVDGKIAGDFNPTIHNSEFIIHYTPTPGGTGPILVAKLFENFYRLLGSGTSSVMPIRNTITY